MDVRERLPDDFFEPIDEQFLTNTTYIKKPTEKLVGFFMYGAPGRIRTSDRSVRSRVLYPAELQAHILQGTHYLGLC